MGPMAACSRNQRVQAIENSQTANFVLNPHQRTRAEPNLKINKGTQTSKSSHFVLQSRVGMRLQNARAATHLATSLEGKLNRQGIRAFHAKIAKNEVSERLLRPTNKLDW